MVFIYCNEGEKQIPLLTMLILGVLLVTHFEVMEQIGIWERLGARFSW